ncbi:MAG: hypothetical protein ISR69_03990 [Gammaproteobacteria bacterium]|nr:hypothetical protein [Gammaproteobacteria bacterium]
MIKTLLVSLAFLMMSSSLLANSNNPWSSNWQNRGYQQSYNPYYSPMPMYGSGIQRNNNNRSYYNGYNKSNNAGMFGPWNTFYDSMYDNFANIEGDIDFDIKMKAIAKSKAQNNYNGNYRGQQNGNYRNRQNGNYRQLYNNYQDVSPYNNYQDVSPYSNSYRNNNIFPNFFNK